MSNYRVGTALNSCLAGNTRIPANSNAVCRLSTKFLDVITRSPWHATAVSTTLNSSAMWSAVLYSPAVTFVPESASNVVRTKTSGSSARGTRRVSNNADVTSRTAGTPALSHAMATRRVSCASRYAMSSAVMQSAQRSAASRALHALKKNVHLAAHTPNAVCLVRLLASGYHVRNVVPSCWLAAINARRSAAPTARAQSIVRSVVLTPSRASALI